MSNKLLIVDDVAFNRLFLIKQLRFYQKKAVMDVFEAGTAGEAYSMIQNVKPQVVITDINLPDKDGFSLLKESKEITNSLPFLFMTAFPVTDFDSQLTQLGVQKDYIFTKPLDIETMRRIVYHFMNIPL